MECIDIKQIDCSGPVQGRVRPPGSKSITNRALVCAGLARGPSTLRGVLDSQDTRVMINAWRELGIEVRVGTRADERVVIGGGGQLAEGPKSLAVENSGTTVRFLTAVVSLGEGTYRLHGNARMHQRPIEDLLHALRQLGCDARSELSNACPPVRVTSHGLVGGTAEVAGNISSQFLSGLLLAAPCAKKAIDICVMSDLVSVPYVEMTLRVMRSFGAEVHASPGFTRLRVDPTGYQGTAYDIEPDASAASYFLAAAAITGGDITIEGLGKESVQGDIQFAVALGKMGCSVEFSEQSVTVRGSRGGDPDGGELQGIDVDMRDFSDMVPTLAAVSLFARSPTRIRNVAHIRHKESDRIADLARELRKLGAVIEEFEDGMRITPAPLHGARIATYDDHRIAMSLATVGLRVPGIAIEDPGCTAKTYPEFFQDLDRVRTRSA